MADGMGGNFNIKQEIDTTTTTNCCSPTTSILNCSNSISFSSSASNQLQTSPSVSPERQLCSSTTTLSGDLLCGNGNENKTGIREEIRRLCLVCGDVASGFHYGVASCEACKAFFKRTIQGNIEYTCPANNECEINKRRRKACQACRFQKCLLMGMLKEGVRLDRVRGGRQKYRRNPVSNSYQTMQMLYQSTTSSLDDIKILEVLNTNEPEALCVYQQHDDVKSFSSKFGGDSHDMLSVLSDLYDKELVGVIGWAKQIPGFTELPLNDQMKLLQISWAEILTLQLAYRSIPFNGKLNFASDVCMDERAAKECGATELYYHCVQIVQRMERLSPRKEEYYLLKALILSNCDVLLDDSSSLRNFRESILNSLNDCVYLLRHTTAVSHQQQLLLLLPSLRQADNIIRRFWRSVCREGNVTMKRLFVEMLER